MEQRRRSGIALGIILVLLGAWFLAVQLVPQFQSWLAETAAWPLIVVGVGLVFLLFAIIGGVPGLAIPGCIVGGIGILLYWNNVTQNWETWAYTWTLIPAFVGVGIIIAGLLGERMRGSLIAGGWLVFISLVLFLIFSSFLGGYSVLGPYWPVLLIALGVILLLRSFIRWP